MYLMIQYHTLRYYTNITFIVYLFCTDGCEDVEDMSIDGAKEVAAVNQDMADVASTDVVVYKVTKSAHRQIQNMLGDIATSIVPPPSDELVAPAAATKKVGK